MEHDVVEEKFGVVMAYEESITPYLDGIKVDYVDYGNSGVFRIINTKRKNDCSSGCSSCD